MDGLTPTEVERFGPYLLLERLAPYGMVQPYLARRQGEIELVVLKRLLPQLAQHPTASQRFAREVRLTRELKHPHLMRTLDAGRVDDELYMVTEFVAGVRLDVLMTDAAQRGRPLPLDVVSGIAVKVLDALAHAHSAVSPEGASLNLVHRDLSPRSVTVSFSGDVKLGDFGGARSRGDVELTAPGTTVGTLAYMSPEQVGQQAIDSRTDLYAFSVVLYELLTGQPMIDAQDALTMLRQIRAGAIVPLRGRRPDLPGSVADVVERGLAKDLAQRWANARAYQNALQAALQPVAPAAAVERIGAFVRARLPGHEARFVELLDRVRSIGAVIPAPPNADAFMNYDEASLISASQTPLALDDPALTERDAPPYEPTPEPSVMTMPGPAIPAQGRPRAKGPRPRRSRSRGVSWGAVGATFVAVVAATIWWGMIAPRKRGPLVVIPVASEQVQIDQIDPADDPPPAVPPVANRVKKASPRPRRKTGAPKSSARAPARPAPPVVPSTVVDASEAESVPPAPAEDRAQPTGGRAPGRLAGFSRRLAELQRAEDDIRAFDALLLDLKRATEGVDPAIQRAVLRDLSAAERSFDIEGLAQALRRLERYESMKP